MSLCVDGLTRISLAGFEVTKSDFEPSRDIDILVMAFLPLEGGE